MKMTSRWFIAAGALAGMLALPASAYNDVVTHPMLTYYSATKSAIYQDPTLLLRLGASTSTPEHVALIMMQGAYEEDLGRRPLNHFYDHANKKPLWFCVFKFICTTSWEWMLEQSEPIGIQNHSLVDAREHLRRALTFNEGAPAEAAHQRGLAMRELFLSLGSVSHHMQDMAQPQHVRDDDHLDKAPLGEDLTPRYRPSLYEQYTVDQSAVIFGYADAASPVYPGSASFKTARDFWFNDSGTGIAEYTNQNFVSAGTNFTSFLGRVRAGTFSLPVPGAPTDVPIEALLGTSSLEQKALDRIRVLCGTPALDCTMTMYPTAVSSRASTLSIFTQDLKAHNLHVVYKETDTTPTYYADRIFALNRFNFDDAHPQLISKAVGYSAGIINHFFRGKLEVAPPIAGGAYAVVDHSTEAGFDTVRAHVTNATPEEDLSGGVVTAIARFHVNHCYKPDLSGEFKKTESGGLEAPSCPGGYRSAEEHIRVATPQALALTAGSSTDVTFVFSAPIPLNATDLLLQVYYEGKVGAEEKTFAVGVVDLSEPTFVAIMNATDVFELGTATGNQFYYYAPIETTIKTEPFSTQVDLNRDGKYASPPDLNVVGGDIRYQISVDGQAVGAVVIPEGRFARLAVLAKPTDLVLTLAALGNGYNQTNAYTLTAKTSQLDPKDNVYLVSPVDKLRNDTLQFNSVTYFHYYPTQSADPKTMPPSKAPDGATPVGLEAAGTQQQRLAPFSNVQQPLSNEQPGGNANVQTQQSPPFRLQAEQGMRTTAQVPPSATPL